MTSSHWLAISKPKRKIKPVKKMGLPDEEEVEGRKRRKRGRPAEGASSKTHQISSKREDEEAEEEDDEEDQVEDEDSMFPNEQ